jgi:hypothetical protein
LPLANRSKSIAAWMGPAFLNFVTSSGDDKDGPQPAKNKNKKLDAKTTFLCRANLHIFAGHLNWFPP